MSDDEIDVVMVQVTRGFADKVLANPGGLRLWMPDKRATGTEMPLGVWHTKAVYNDNPGDRPIYRFRKNVEKLFEHPKAKVG
jgi:hypothetical protein